MSTQFTNSSSSVITKFGYDEEKQELHLHFRSGQKYVYRNVPPDVHDGLQSAASHGKFINANILGKYEHA